MFLYTNHCSMLCPQVEQEICLKMQASSSWMEQFVAHHFLSCLPSGSALFQGDTMPIRDADMLIERCKYGRGPLARSGFMIGWYRVGVSRGVGDIAGMLCTAIGFAAGSGQQVKELSILASGLLPC
jgi:2-succinyl-5-enolpyruvyl-6-hydroxy-3-cyclohexene-1-carboxylate synthase